MQFCGVFHSIDAVMEESAGLGWRLAALARFGVGRRFPAGVGLGQLLQEPHPTSAFQ
jgi:hypothetical protein